MQNLGKFTDTDIQSDYTLYFGSIAEVKELLTKVYGTINPKDFISTPESGGDKVENMIKDNSAKITGLYHNTFLITQDLFTASPLLIDGFSRLFVAYDLIKDHKVFIKDYTALTNTKAMALLGIVNFWKTTNNFGPLFDRGFTLYMFMRFGYNISHLLKESYGEPIIGYFEKKPPLFYLYDWRQIKLDSKMIFENERVFDDILALGKLYDLRTANGHPHAVQFYIILNKFRNREPNKLFDTDSFIAWLNNTPKMAELATSLNNSHNVTSKETIMNEAQQYAWNKYILPTVFNEEGGQTLQEKKKAFQASVVKLKRGYKKLTFDEIRGLPKNTKLYNINHNGVTFEIRVTCVIFLNYTTSENVITSKIGFAKDRPSRTEIYHKFTFKQEDDKEYTRTYYNEFSLVREDSGLYIKK